jgi:hypothetical protein
MEVIAEESSHELASMPQAEETATAAKGGSDEEGIEGLASHAPHTDPLTAGVKFIVGERRNHRKLDRKYEGIHQGHAGTPKVLQNVR